VIPVRPLSYDYDALEPALSGEQLRLHHDVLYRRYVERTNTMTQGRWTRPAEAVREALSRHDPALFDQAAQAWSHEFYFDSMTPGADGPDELALRLLGPGFADRWVAAATSVFGSGWVWLVCPRHGSAPRIVTTKDAQLPVDPAIMVMDVWEHAYYCEYPGRRAEYAREWVAHLADWGRLTALYAPPGLPR
jgi:Fe-Mn family superoxide dismutase